MVRYFTITKNNGLRRLEELILHNTCMCFIFPHGFPLSNLGQTIARPPRVHARCIILYSWPQRIGYRMYGMDSTNRIGTVTKKISVNEMGIYIPVTNASENCPSPPKRYKNKSTASQSHLCLPFISHSLRNTPNNFRFFFSFFGFVVTVFNLRHPKFGLAPGG